jgi:very-short-patch-repair endonuclease
MDKELFRQSLINAKTPAESRLLYILSKDDYLFDKFEFQKPIGHYFADFCFDFKKLVVELDGSSHNGRKNKDRNRTKDIKELGYNVIRFSNDIVFKRPDVVIRKIMMARADHPHVCGEHTYILYSANIKSAYNVYVLIV